MTSVDFGREPWDGKWPPSDPLIRLLSDLLDASPRSDWLTSNQRVAEAERLIRELERRKWRIVR